MTLRLRVDRGQCEYFTNFDTLQGVVELELNSSESISAITVKAEGLSRSVCYTEPGNGKTRSKVPITELHKVLYLTRTVFPDVLLRRSSSTSSFTLPAGKHSWPFSFQIPINNDCKSEAGSKALIGAFIQGNPAGLQQRHVQQILPPSMTGNDEIWVRYFVKVTVERPSRLVLNRREQVPFVFLPIEAPRAEDNAQGEAFFVRRQHTLALPDANNRLKVVRDLLSDAKRRKADTIAVEVRLPNPPLIIPGVPLNITVMGFLESNRNENHLVISKIVIHLLVTTKVRAGGLNRQLGNRLLCYSENFNVRLTPQMDASRPAATLSLLGAHPFMLATDTPPTFSTCNLARTYNLEIAVTLTQELGMQELVVLTCPVTVLSGVQAPPPQDNAVSSEVLQNSGYDDERHGSTTDALPSYKEAVKVGAPSSASVIPNNRSRSAIRTRTSYRVGDTSFKGARPPD